MRTTRILIVDDEPDFTALLKENPSPTREEVRAGLGGNLCRCGTYMGVIDAVLEAAKTMKGGA